MGVLLEYKKRTLALLEEEDDSYSRIAKYLHSQVFTARENSLSGTTVMPSAVSNDKKGR